MKHKMSLFAGPFERIKSGSCEDQIAGMREVYSEERKKKLGVLGIHIRLAGGSLSF